ncbi:MAG: lytic transglycosylase domain-containing protein, partial [Luteimonas sp.]|nr:lytic transglycosylase domain-containing protein [Luteimonas sp.]
MAAAIGTPGRERRPSRVAIRCASAALLLATGGWALAALAREVPPPAYQLAAHRADVPAAVLYAVALQES